MSVQAITWVLEDAPDLPPHLVSTLLALANHADRDGRASFPAQAVIAAYTRKADRNVRNDLRALLKLGLIREGDQRLVSHFRPDRRPVVYDLATERKQDRQQRDDRTPTSGRGDNDGRTHTSARNTKTTGRTHPPVDRKREDAHDRSSASGRTHTSPRQHGQQPHNDRMHSVERGDAGILQTVLNQNLSLSVEALIADALDLTDEREISDVLKNIRTASPDIRSEDAFIRRLIANGDIHKYRRPTKPTTPTYTGPTHDFQPSGTRDDESCAAAGCGRRKPHAIHRTEANRS